MNHKTSLVPCVLAAAMATACAPLAVQADDHGDFGLKVEQLLKAQSEKLFGVQIPLAASAPSTVGAYRTASQTAYEQVLVAHGLKVEYLTRTAANKTDMMAFYPAENPTHLISCVEGGREFLTDGGTPGVYDAGDKLNPSIQRIDLNSGAVETILRGMSACDGIRTTSWGTILATEERSDGGAYELLNPLGVSEQTVMDRASGAIFKFLPAMPRLVTGPIADLSESPLAAGSVYAMQVSCTTGQQYGQGCEIR